MKKFFFGLVLLFGVFGLEAQTVNLNLDSLKILDGVKKQDSLISVISIVNNPTTYQYPVPSMVDSLNNSPFMIKRMNVEIEVKVYKDKAFKEFQKTIKANLDDNEVERLRVEKQEAVKRLDDAINKRKEANDALKKFKST